jgi:DNA modification methylase
MGSGTTGVAAIQIGCHFLGIEINPTYCAIAKERIAKAELACVKQKET